MVGQAVKRGFSLLLPLLITFVIVGWILIGMEHLFHILFFSYLPENYYFPGLGLIVGCLVLFVLSLLLNAWIFQQTANYIERLLEKSPTIKVIYQSMKKMIAVFFSTEQEIAGQPVIVTLDHNLQLLGLISNNTPQEIDDSLKGQVAVFLPMSYQIGGYTVLVEREKITRLNMSRQEALGLIFSAGVSSGGDSKGS
ncbi:MAG: DUF502 domain-containing protein [Chlamydiota bacterium]